MPEKKIVTKNCGTVDPNDIDSSLAHDGFMALVKARNQMTPEEVIAEVKASGLRGRGGAGFPCGMKWEMARRSPGNEKFLICNADESEMGTFKDRHLVQNDPFSLIEGIAIASYAIGAARAYVYLRQEYHYLLDLLLEAIRQAEDKNLLNGLKIEVAEGAGAYVCGEETALMNSIQGQRGEVRFRPPFPPVCGLWQQPTIINNVETLMNLPQIILNGASWFGMIGTAAGKGTKVFSISGDVEKPGIYELPLGSSLQELVIDLAQAHDVKMVQVGGAPGRIVRGDCLDVPLGFETMLGSGAVVVFDSSRSVVRSVLSAVEFLAEESCGKCAPCREGTQVMVEIFERLSKGEGIRGDLETMELLAKVMRDSSLCGLGQGIANPVLDSLELFKTEYENRIDQSSYLRTL